MSIKFSRYFRSWLHENYYTNAVNIGKKGDFYTSVSVGSLFGVILAHHFVTLVRSGEFGKYTHVVEIGASDGSMLCDFISGVYTFAPDLLATLSFNIIEPHENLRQIQQAKFSQILDSDIVVTHFNDLSECSFEQAFFISNELFDSFNCEVIDQGKMLYIKDGAQIWHEAEADVLARAAKFKVTRGEIMLGIDEFAAKVAASADRLKFISFDYGQMGARNEITLRIFKNHCIFSLLEIADLRPFFGVSDLTYSLDFMQLKTSFGDAGFKFNAFKKQSAALIDFGAINVLETAKKGSERAYKEFVKQFKFLSNPDFLGEKFKMIEFEK